VEHLQQRQRQHPGGRCRRRGRGGPGADGQQPAARSVRCVQQAWLQAQEAAAVRGLQGGTLLRRAVPAAALAGAPPGVHWGGAAGRLSPCGLG
jgi:hypothetical protein